MNRSISLAFCLVLSLLLAGGCASYATPGAGADLRTFGVAPEVRLEQTDATIARELEKKPLAGFPARIAVVRVQGAGYKSYTTTGWGSGRYTIVTSRDVEDEADFRRLAGLPQVAGVAPVNRLLLETSTLNDDRPLREAAARLQADMLLIYTFDTAFRDRDGSKPLTVVTLGLSPHKQVQLTSTASAILLDTRNGFVYGVAEATASAGRQTNAWQRQEDADKARQEAEREAFARLTDELEVAWTGVVSQHAGGLTSTLKQ